MDRPEAIKPLRKALPPPRQGAVMSPESPSVDPQMVDMTPVDMTPGQRAAVAAAAKMAQAVVGPLDGEPGAGAPSYRLRPCKSKAELAIARDFHREQLRYLQSLKRLRILAVELERRGMFEEVDAPAPPVSHEVGAGEDQHEPGADAESTP